MPTAKTYTARRRALLKQLTDADVQALLITNETNVTYLTGFTGDSSWLIVGKGKSLLISDGRYTTQIEEQCPGLDMLIRGIGETMPKVTAGVLDKLSAKVVGVEASSLSLAAFNSLSEEVEKTELKPTSGLVEGLRAVKDDEEVASIREAIRIAEAGFAYIRERIDSESLEIVLAHDLEHVIRQFGALGLSFPPIIGVDDRAALPHYEPGRIAVGNASQVLIDWGAREPGGYISDITRTLMSPKAPKKLLTIYETVLKANQAGIKAIRPGVKASAVDKAARRVIEKAGFGKQFNHSLGHGIGLDVHEAIRLAEVSKDVLQPGMVVTVEPGIYLPGYGGVRIEDDVLVTEDGCEVLSSTPKALDACTVSW